MNLVNLDGVTNTKTSDDRNPAVPQTIPNSTKYNLMEMPNPSSLPTPDHAPTSKFLYLHYAETGEFS